MILQITFNRLADKPGTAFHHRTNSVFFPAGVTHWPENTLILSYSFWIILLILILGKIITITRMNFMILKLLPTHLMKGDAPAKTMSCRSTKKAKMKVLWKFISRLEVKILGAQALRRHTRSSHRHCNLLYSCVCSSFSYLLAVWRSQKGQTCVQRRRHQL